MGDDSLCISKTDCQKLMERIIKYFPEIVSSEEKMKMLKMLMPLYEDWNSKINVISRKDIGELYLHHVLHSLAIIKTGLVKDGDTVMDVGCGGGFPVIPLAIMMPDVKFYGIDSIGKKIKVVNGIVTSLGLKNVTTVNDRVELVNLKTDWVVSRAVTALPQFVKWTWSKTSNGILYLKGGDLSEEIQKTGKQTILFDISRWFDEEYFVDKKIVCLKKIQ